MVNGVTYASLDRAPLIAITDQYPPHVLETGLRQVVDQRQLFSGITKWSTTVNAKSAAQQIERAIRTATAPAQGPVHLDLPSSETTREAPKRPTSPLSRENVPVGNADFSTAARLVNASSQPIILVGLGALRDDACAEVSALAERLGAPVLTTAKSKGVIPEDHPLRAGCIIGGVIEQRLVEQSDLIVTIGFDPVELQPKPWPYNAPVLALCSVASTDVMVPTTVELTGSLGLLVAGLADLVPGGQDWGETVSRKFRQDVSRALDVRCAGLSAQRCVELARESLPQDAIATCDAGASRLLVVQKWRSFGPREFLTSNGLGTMGYAIPGALGARLAWPDRPIIAFTGDGGFMMSLAELQTSVREQLPIITVVFDDSEIALIRVKQEIKGLPRHGVGIGGMHWEQLAEGFGIDCTVAENENQFVDGLERAIANRQQSSLVVARIDGGGYVAQFNALREL